MRSSRLAPLLLAFATPLFGVTPLQEKVRAWRVARENELIAEYRELLAIPNASVDRANIRRNADFIVAMMKRRGIEARLLTIPTPTANPVVFGEVKVPGATRTIMLYAHYDGMPVNPAQWAPGWEPFAPKFATASAERGGKIVDSWKPGDPIDPSWRITGRGAADDKAGVFTLLNAYAALVATGQAPTANLKFFIEGEEEFGSVNLREIIAAHREALRADLWIVLDGPCHPSGKKAVMFGARGDINVNLTVFGPKRPLHSGNYGNWAPNPSQLLVNLLASMKADDGRVLVPGFYDDVIPLTEAERRAVAAIPSVEAELKRELGFARPEVAGRTLFEGFALPSLNINGIQGANVGAQAANVIPTVARAVIDLRLVAGNDAQRQVAKVVAHIRARGWHVLDRDPTDEERAQHAKLIRVETKSAGTNAQRTPMDWPVAQAVVAAVQSTVDYPVVLLPTLGGTLPSRTIEELLDVKLLTVPVVNADNNQHAENENVKVQALWDGLETYTALMTMR
ncbi:MAG: M20/M25/M40 family metallo-hydrolase [Verrucomicrobia bacterium]|nr:M20/M25/M40 family metallo-hydrolase [Verrucomicrobiota bacterium]